MGFSLDMFFEELIEIIDSDEKGSKKIKRLIKCIYEAHRYAKVCGLIENKPTKE